MGVCCAGVVAGGRGAAVRVGAGVKIWERGDRGDAKVKESADGPWSETPSALVHASVAGGRADPTGDKVSVGGALEETVASSAVAACWPSSDGSLGAGVRGNDAAIVWGMGALDSCSSPCCCAKWC
eukprot:scaffold93410_cov14-Tisochrysis_lutea.AAC.1